MKESAQMNTETKQPKSVLQQVKEYLADNATIVVSEFAKASGLPRNQISTALWKLQKLDMVKKAGVGVYERLELTPVNKPKKKRKVRAKQTVTMTDRAVVAERDNRFYKEQLEDFAGRLRSLNVKYQDALVLIRYLEEKLFKAIQFDAKNNGNA